MARPNRQHLAAEVVKTERARWRVAWLRGAARRTGIEMGRCVYQGVNRR